MCQCLWTKFLRDSRAFDIGDCVFCMQPLSGMQPFTSCARTFLWPCPGSWKSLDILKLKWGGLPLCFPLFMGQENSSMDTLAIDRMLVILWPPVFFYQQSSAF